MNRLFWTPCNCSSVGIGGIYPDVFLELQKIMNFSFSVQKSVDGSFGAKLVRKTIRYTFIPGAIAYFFIPAKLIRVQWHHWNAAERRGWYRNCRSDIQVGIISKDTLNTLCDFHISHKKDSTFRNMNIFFAVTFHLFFRQDRAEAVDLSVPVSEDWFTLFVRYNSVRFNVYYGYSHTSAYIRINFDLRTVRGTLKLANGFSFSEGFGNARHIFIGCDCEISRCTTYQGWEILHIRFY